MVKNKNIKGLLLILVVLPLLSVGSIGLAQAQTQISNYQELQDMRNNLTGSYVLVNNINLSGFDYGDGKGFMPVGDYDNRFTGKFDGQGFNITGLYINRPSQNYVGLFGYTGSGAEIKNVGLIDVNVNGGYWVGGLVGLKEGGTISNSYSTGSVSGGNGVGGLVGGSDYGIINNSYSTGGVSGGNYAGGLVGGNWGGTISNSYSTGSVSGSSNSYYAGGLVGWNWGETISNSYSTGNVSGGNGVGGLVGGNGYGIISNSYSTGSVSGGNYAGGLVGWHYYEGTISNSYWNTETSGQTTSAGGEPRTTAQMTSKPYDNTTYVGWDFVNIWLAHTGLVRDHQGNTGYPALFWTQSLNVESVTLAIGSVQTAKTQIASLASSVFKNANMQNALLNKLDDVIANIEAGNYTEALGQLQNDILAKTDGCATSGAPDNNDWIGNCTSQGIIYPYIRDAISKVTALL